MTIMISAANSDISDSLCRIHKELYPNERVIGIAPDGFWPASCVFDKVYDICLVQDPGYILRLNQVIREEKVSIFVPTSETELRFIIQNEMNFSPDIQILINPAKILKCFLNKEKTMEFILTLGVKCPETRTLCQVTPQHLPVIIKPNESAGSKNTYIVHTWSYYRGILDELSHMNIEHNAMIAQRYLPSHDEEYTCAISKINNQAHFLILKRKLIGGITGRATISQHPKILETLDMIANAIDEDFFINVQLRLDNEVPVVFEINPRFSSTVMLRHLVGFQDYKWHMNRIKEGSLPKDVTVENKEMFRVFREVVQ